MRFIVCDSEKVRSGTVCHHTVIYVHRQRARNCNTSNKTTQLILFVIVLVITTNNLDKANKILLSSISIFLIVSIFKIIH